MTTGTLNKPLFPSDSFEPPLPDRERLGDDAISVGLADGHLPQAAPLTTGDPARVVVDGDAPDSRWRQAQYMVLTPIIDLDDTSLLEIDGERDDATDEHVDRGAAGLAVNTGRWRRCGRSWSRPGPG